MAKIKHFITKYPKEVSDVLGLAFAITVVNGYMIIKSYTPILASPEENSIDSLALYITVAEVACLLPYMKHNISFVSNSLALWLANHAGAETFFRAPSCINAPCSELLDYENIITALTANVFSYGMVVIVKYIVTPAFDKELLQDQKPTATIENPSPKYKNNMCGIM